MFGYSTARRAYRVAFESRRRTTKPRRELSSIQRNSPSAPINMPTNSSHAGGRPLPPSVVVGLVLTSVVLLIAVVCVAFVLRKPKKSRIPARLFSDGTPTPGDAVIEVYSPPDSPLIDLIDRRPLSPLTEADLKAACARVARNYRLREPYGEA